jgi:DNA-binding NtrC family response regulator
MMHTSRKRILICDEAGFSRICSAILEKEGYGTSTIPDVSQVEAHEDYSEYGLVITSYPYGARLLENLKETRTPIIILSDRMNRDLVLTLDHFDKGRSHCMIKPLDYHKFRTLVNDTMSRSEEQGGRASS